MTRAALTAAARLVGADHLKRRDLNKAAIPIACRLACIEIGREWRARKLRQLEEEIQRDPSLLAPGEIREIRDDDLILSREESAAALERLRNTPPLVDRTPPTPAQTAAIDDTLYRQHAALWNMRVDQRRAAKEGGEA